MVLKKAKKYIDYLITIIIRKLKEKVYAHNNQKIKYLYYKSKTNQALIIVFSACTREGIKARYNYVRTLKNINCSKLFILDDGGIDGRGTYYLGERPDFKVEKATMSLIKNIIKEINPRKVVFVGSSKGGWAAINFGLQFDNSYIIAGAPQYYLGDYLSRIKGKVTINSLKCDNKEGIELLDRYLSKRIKEAKKNTSVFLQYSKNDITYKSHIKYLINDLNKKNISTFLEELDYKNHDDVSIFFPGYITKNIFRLLEGDNVEKKK